MNGSGGHIDDVTVNASQSAILSLDSPEPEPLPEWSRVKQVGLLFIRGQTFVKKDCLQVIISNVYNAH
jgi:hypothetical protein